MILGGVSGSRRLTSWIEGFIEYTEIKPSPRIFRLWTAIATVASAASRKVWVHTYGADLYPNLYVFLVGAPASGKTVPIDVVREDIWRQLGEGFHIAPKSLTAASLADSLSEAKFRIMRPMSVPNYEEFNSLTILSPELGNFVSTYENDMMQRLTDIYDCGPYEERRRGKDLNIVIPKAQLNILAATTPSHLGAFMPVTAWDQGFASRIIMVFSGEATLKDLFDVPDTSSSLRTALIDDLKTIGALYGKLSWSEEARQAMRQWHMAGGPPAPDHIRLTHYVGRRSAHLLKLCTIATISRTNEPIIQLSDFELALSWLLEAEELMPDIFKAMKGATIDGSAIDEAWYFCWSIWTKEKRPIAESRLVHFLQQRVPAYSVMRLIELLQRSNMIRVVDVNNAGNLFEPVPKGRHVAQ